MITCFKKGKMSEGIQPHLPLSLSLNTFGLT